MSLYIDDGLPARPNSKIMLSTDMKLTGAATCSHESTNARIFVVVHAKTFVLNSYGNRRIAAEAAYRKVKSGKGRRLETTGNHSRELKTSEFLRQLK